MSTPGNVTTQALARPRSNSYPSANGGNVTARPDSEPKRYSIRGGRQNGFDLLEQSETELAEVLERLGSRSIGQGEFFEWVANHMQPLDADGSGPEVDR